MEEAVELGDEADQRGAPDVPDVLDTAMPESSRHRRPDVREGHLWVFVTIIVCLLVILVLAAGVIVQSEWLGDRDAQDGQQAAALAEARTYATDLSTYDYRHLAQDFGKVQAESTPSFRASFGQTSGALSTLLKQYKAVATAHVLDAGVVSLNPTTAVVIVFLDQSVDNTAQANGATTDRSRMVLTLKWSGDRWLLQDLRLK